MAKNAIPMDLAIKWAKEGRIKGDDAEWILSHDYGNKPKKKPKFNNVKVEYDGHVFDSKKEYNRYRELLLLLKAGEIGQLKCQESFELIEKTDTNRKMCYKADFTYIIAKTGERVVEDVKSEPTRKQSTYINKKKLMKAKYGIDIKEI